LAVLLNAVPVVAAEKESIEQGHVAPAQVFQPPSSDAERALNSILKWRDPGGPVYRFLTDQNGGRKLYEKRFDRHFTVPLLDAVAALERKLVKEECRGRYVEGDMCGIGYNPLNCAQDDPPNGYHFLVESAGEGTEVIATAWRASGPVTARYRVTRYHGTWAIDAISCPDGDSFNW